MKDRTLYFFLATYAAQGLVGIAYEPIYYLQKDVMGLTPEQSGAFASIMTLPFLFKPLLGLISDCLPLGKRRRVPYLAAAALATSAAWLALSLMPSYPMKAALILLTAVNVGIAFIDVLCDGVMVEKGKRLGTTGRYQAVQIGALSLCLFATGLGGGWLAQNASYKTIFALTASFPLLILATLWTVEEASPREESAARAAASGLRSLFIRPGFWSLCAVILLFNFKPYLGTSMFYYQADSLGFSKILLGWLGSIDGFFSWAGAALFWKLLGKKNLDSLILARWIVLLGAPLTFLWLGYKTPLLAVLLTAFFGLAGTAMRLGLMDLAAKASPEGAEATAFAIFMSVFNLSAWASNALGAAVYGRFSATEPHTAFTLLVVIGAVFTALCWPLLKSAAQDQPA